MLQISFLFFALTAIQNPVSQETKGVVVTPSGDPLSEVSVLAMPTGETVRSNERGEFVISELGDFIRFSASGFRPMTKSRKELLAGSPVVMQPDFQAIWKPQACSSTQTNHTMKGDWMVFSLPEGTNYRSEISDDVTAKIVCRRKYCMRLSWGPLWSFGFPARGFLKGFTITSERDIQCRPEVGLQAMEYRGTRGNGRMTRWVGWLSETICYEDVPPEVVEFFDIIMDSLCWSSRR